MHLRPRHGRRFLRHIRRVTALQAMHVDLNDRREIATCTPCEVTCKTHKRAWSAHRVNTAHYSMRRYVLVVSLLAGCVLGDADEDLSEVESAGTSYQGTSYQGTSY